MAQPEYTGTRDPKATELLNALNNRVEDYFNRLDYQGLSEVLRQWEGRPPLKSEIIEHITEKALEGNEKLMERVREVHNGELVHEHVVRKSKIRINDMLKSLIRRGTIEAFRAASHRKFRIEFAAAREVKVYMHADRIRKSPGRVEWIPHREFVKK